MFDRCEPGPGERPFDRVAKQVPGAVGLGIDESVGGCGERERLPVELDLEDAARPDVIAGGDVGSLERRVGAGSPERDDGLVAQRELDDPGFGQDVGRDRRGRSIWPSHADNPAHRWNRFGDLGREESPQWALGLVITGIAVLSIGLVEAAVSIEYLGLRMGIERVGP